MKPAYYLIYSKSTDSYSLVEGRLGRRSYSWRDISNVFNPEHFHFFYSFIQVPELLADPDKVAYPLYSGNLEGCKLRYPELFI